LFGLHRTHPAARVDASGLARFLHGGSITEVTTRYARVRRRTGSILTFRRTDPPPGAVPAWELHDHQGETIMFDYSIDLDIGATEQGPWLHWYAAGSRDGAHPAGAFVIREAGGTATAVNLSGGIVFDWPGSLTGWMQSGGTPGVAPRKNWNQSRAKMEAQPGPDWKKAFRVQIAYLPSNGVPARAVWEQAQIAAWQCYVNIMTLLKEAGPGSLPNLPLIAFTGHRAMRLGAGTTLIPECNLIRYVPRPACLPEEVGAQPRQPSGATWGGQLQQSGIAAWGAAAPAPPLPPTGRTAGDGAAGDRPQPAAARPAVAPAAGTLIDDEIPYAPCVL
jgi:hypothetical protein